MNMISRPASGEATGCDDGVVNAAPDVAEVAASDLALPAELSRRNLRSRLLIAVGLILLVIAVVTLLPGLGGLRSRLSHAKPEWLLLGVGLKVLSGLGYVAAFRMVFCRRMSWRVSYQIGMSELAADALFPTGGAGGLALGAWALRRGGMAARDIARRTVAFFLLTSVPNVVGVILIGFGLATGIITGERNLLLTAVPAAVAAAAIVGVLLGGRGAGRWALRMQSRSRHESSRRARALRGSLIALADGVEEALALLREANLVLILGLFAYLVFDVAILWATFRALGPTPPLAIVAIAYLLGELGGLIPVPGGIGGIDAGLVGTLALYNVSLASAAGAVLAYRAIALWVPATVGGAAFVLLRRTLRDEADRVAVCAPQTEIEVIGLGRVVIRAEAH
jgi:uncharacterized protein (TIRG00374 family)